MAGSYMCLGGSCSSYHVTGAFAACTRNLLPSAAEAIQQQLPQATRWNRFLVKHRPIPRLLICLADGRQPGPLKFG